MKVKYDRENDILYIKFSEAQVSESDEERKGIILDYDALGNITGIEIINASKNIVQPSKLEYEVAWLHDFLTARLNEFTTTTLHDSWSFAYMNIFAHTFATKYIATHEQEFI